SQEVGLAVQPTAVTSEDSPGAGHTVTRDDDRDRVGAERVADSAGGAWRSNRTRDLAVGRDCAVGNVGGAVEHAPAECPDEGPVERYREVAQLAREVGVQLAPHGVQAAGSLEDAR